MDPLSTSEVSKPTQYITDLNFVSYILYWDNQRWGHRVSFPHVSSQYLFYPYPESSLEDLSPKPGQEAVCDFFLAYLNVLRNQLKKGRGGVWLI